MIRLNRFTLNPRYELFRALSLVFTRVTPLVTHQRLHFPSLPNCSCPCWALPRPVIFNKRWITGALLLVPLLLLNFCWCWAGFLLRSHEDQADSTTSFCSWASPRRTWKSCLLASACFLCFKKPQIFRCGVALVMVWFLSLAGSCQCLRCSGCSRPPPWKPPGDPHSSLLYFAAVSCDGWCLSGFFVGFVGHIPLKSDLGKKFCPAAVPSARLGACCDGERQR